MPHRSIAFASLVLALLVPVTAGAVSIEKGVKAGVNLANFRGGFADIADTRTKAGFVGGAFVAFGFAPDLALQVEGLFSMKGAKTVSERTDDAGNPRGEIEDFWKLSYLEVPVLLRGTLMRTAPVQPMFYVGPTLGFSLGGRFGDDLSEHDLTDLKPVDLGVAVGAGAGFELGGKKVRTEVRYTTGFGDLYDLKDNLESINNVFSLTAGLAF